MIFTRFATNMEIIIETHIPPPQSKGKEELINKIYGMSVSESAWIDSLFIKSSDLIVGLTRLNKKSGTDHTFTTKKEAKDFKNGFRIWRLS